MTNRKITDVTDVVADDIVSILDYVSRVKQAADDGNANYMHDKALSLMRACEGLYRHLSDLADDGPPYRHDPSKQFDATRLRTLITHGARHYEAGRALYSKDGNVVTADVSARVDTEMRRESDPS